MLVSIQCFFLSTQMSPFRLTKTALLVGGLGALIAFVVAFQVARKQSTITGSPLLLTLLSFPALQAFSSFWSGQPRWALSSALVSLSLVIAAAWLSGLTTRQRSRLIRFTAFGVTISSAVLLLQLAGNSPINVAATGRRSLTGLSGNPSDLAIAATLLLPLLLVRCSSPRPRSLDWFLAATLSAAIVATRSLTAVVALALFGLVILIRYRTRKRAWAIAIAVVISTSIVAYSSGLTERLARTARTFSKGKVYEALSARTDGWTAATEMIRSAPVLGVGAANYSHRYYSNRLSFLERNQRVGQRPEQSTHFEWAHNDLLQLMAELGLLGFVWLACLVVFTVKAGAGYRPLLIGSFAVLPPFLVFHYPTHIAIGQIPIILLLAELVTHEKKLKLPRNPRIRAGLAATLVVMATASTVWAVQRVKHGRWMFFKTQALELAQSAPAEVRSTVVPLIYEEGIDYASKHPHDAAEVWRLVAMSSLVSGDAQTAEASFRHAHSLWPHSESDLGIGRALVAQGRREEAIHCFARVIRVNPRLASLLGSEELAAEVQNYLEFQFDR
jgi:O-antigen ligase